MKQQSDLFGVCILQSDFNLLALAHRAGKLEPKTRTLNNEREHLKISPDYEGCAYRRLCSGDRVSTISVGDCVEACNLRLNWFLPLQWEASCCQYEFRDGRRGSYTVWPSDTSAWINVIKRREILKHLPGLRFNITDLFIRRHSCLKKELCECSIVVGGGCLLGRVFRRSSTGCFILTSSLQLPNKSKTLQVPSCGSRGIF